MSSSEPYNYYGTSVIEKDEPINDWDYGLREIDEDLNGNNGLEYVCDEAQELGFESNYDYYISLIPNKQPKSIDELKANWEFLCEKIFESDGFYHCHEISFAEIETKNAMVVIGFVEGTRGY